MSFVAALGAIMSLCLFDSVALPGGVVRRVCLFGYVVGDEVLSAEEAAERAAVAVGSLGVVLEPPAERTVELDTEAPTPTTQSPCTDDYTARDRELFDDEDDYLDTTPVQARAVVCPLCQGGRRHHGRGMCIRCDNRRVRLWVNSSEIKAHPPTSDAARIAAAYALSDILHELSDEQIVGARTLLNVVLAGASRDVRSKAMKQWTFALDQMVADAEMRSA